MISSVFLLAVWPFVVRNKHDSVIRSRVNISFQIAACLLDSHWEEHLQLTKEMKQQFNSRAKVFIFSSGTKLVCPTTVTFDLTLPAADAVDNQRNVSGFFLLVFFLSTNSVKQKGTLPWMAFCLHSWLHFTSRIKKITLQHKAFILFCFFVLQRHACLPGCKVQFYGQICVKSVSEDKASSVLSLLSVKSVHVGTLITLHSLSQDKQSIIINVGRAIGPESWIKATGGSGEKPIRRRKPLIKSCMLYRLHQFYFSSATAKAHNFPKLARMPVHIPGQLSSVSKKFECQLPTPHQTHTPLVIRKTKKFS